MLIQNRNSARRKVVAILSVGVILTTLAVQAVYHQINRYTLYGMAAGIFVGIVVCIARRRLQR